ncbi:hypothetical protein [Moorena producens]|uniref:hypothetical protein n=1 Tax=Moorena producens TaxID=1155739 RepID=UPI003C7697AB
MCSPESGGWGDREIGRWGDGEIGRWGDGEMGRWGKPVKVHCFSTVPDSRFPIPCSRFPIPDNCREVYYSL